ncbi:MAG: S1 family peptidase [Pseudobdellovibrionaceae bacterium]
MFRLALSFILFALVSCGYRSNQQNVEISNNAAVMGGTLVNQQQSIYTGIVAIYDIKEKGFCTGSLIGENYILTAAHCVQTKPGNLKIIFSTEIDDIISSHEPDISQSYTRNVKGFKVFPSFNSKERQNKESDWGDIAIIKFSGTVPPGYKPVPVLTDESILQPGLIVTVAGYGVSVVDSKPVDVKRIANINQAIEDGDVLCEDEANKRNCVAVDMSGDGELRQTNVTVASVQNTEFRLDESKGHGTCSGDSGGPVYLEQNGQNFLVGVTSRGSPLCNEVGVYTKVSTYKDWIASTVQQLQTQ